MYLHVLMLTGMQKFAYEVQIIVHVEFVWFIYHLLNLIVVKAYVY